MKEVTEQGAYLQLAQLCARAEHCQYELTEKMRRWDMSDEAQARVMQRLVSERYVDDERYTRAFVHDKIRYNKWGRRKVEEALWMKHIDEDIQERVLSEVDDDEYIAVLKPLLQQKRRSIKADSDYELNQKLVKFALGRGFTFDIINHCMAVLVFLLVMVASTVNAQPRRQRVAFTTDTAMVHDPVMAFEDGKYYLLSTGMGIQWATSEDRKTWTVQPTPFLKDIPQWTHDSVPGFRNHVWAPDIIRKDGLWWLAYSCSTFGKNTSAIGLMVSERLSGPWRDCGPLVCSHEWRKDRATGQTEGNNWNAIDPNFIVDDKGTPWLTWGSFWDGIQMARLDHTMHLASAPKTIARRVALRDTLKTEANPTSQSAGRNAIEAPFIFRHGDYYYLFVSWDYCCRGAKSNYRVAVGRSKNVAGPYLDRNGKDMLNGGGTIILEGDKQEYEAAGHCAVYHFPLAQTGQETGDGGQDIFICHGYSTKMNGAALLIQRTIKWTPDGWPTL